MGANQATDSVETIRIGKFTVTCCFGQEELNAKIYREFTSTSGQTWKLNFVIKDLKENEILRDFLWQFQYMELCIGELAYEIEIAEIISKENFEHLKQVLQSIK